MKSYLPQGLQICTILNILNILFLSIPHFSKIRLNKTQPGGEMGISNPVIFRMFIPDTLSNLSIYMIKLVIVPVQL